jgi:predicted RNA binding protein YcfA (HicA-like mRNA interferase family)
VSKVPSLPYTRIVHALQRDGWTVVRQRGSHIRLQKHEGDEVLKLTIPTHRPVKRSTFAHVLKQARINIEFETAIKNVVYNAVGQASRLSKGYFQEKPSCRQVGTKGNENIA